MKLISGLFVALVLLSGLYGMLAVYSINESTLQNINQMQQNVSDILVLLVPHTDNVCGWIQDAFYHDNLNVATVTVYSYSLEWLNEDRITSGYFCVKLPHVYAVNQLILKIELEGYLTEYIPVQDTISNYFMMKQLRFTKT